MIGMKAALITGTGLIALIVWMWMIIGAKSNEIELLNENLLQCSTERAISEAVNESNKLELAHIKEELEVEIERSRSLEKLAHRIALNNDRTKYDLNKRLEDYQERLANSGVTDCSEHPVRSDFIRMYNEVTASPSAGDSEEGGSSSEGNNQRP